MNSIGSVKSYFVGFILSILFTFIPYYLVVDKLYSNSVLIWLVFLFAVIQYEVQIFFFLHVDFKRKNIWNLISLAFAILILLILVCGSLWIMHHLAVNMMP